MAQFEIPDIDVNNAVSDLTDALTDAFHVGVGFGVITFQKAQVQRRELTKRLSDQVAEAREPINKLGDDAEARLHGARSELDDRLKVIEQRLETVESRVESVLDDVEAKLPPQARELVTQARSTAKDARTQVESLVNRNASTGTTKASTTMNGSAKSGTAKSGTAKSGTAKSGTSRTTSAA